MHSKPDEPKTEATIASGATASAPPPPGDPKPIGALLAAALPSSPLGQLSLLTVPEPQRGSPVPSEGELKPRLPPSKRTRNNVYSIASAIEARRDETQILAFSPEDFVRFGLPYKKPEGVLYTRRNGAIRYEITGSSKYGIPYGQDRLLPIWLATAYTICGQPEDGVIRFRAVRDILSAFGRAAGGFEFKSLKESVLRLTYSTIFVYDERDQLTRTGIDPKDAELLEIRRYNLIDRVHLWFDKKKNKQTNQFTLWQNTIKLSADFAAALREKVMPLDLDTVRALKDKPAALDLYVWQAHRSWELHQRGQKSVGVPIFGETGLLAQLGTQVTQEKKARWFLRQNQKLVEAVWKGCPNHLTKDGNRLVLRPAEALKDARLALPGVTSRPPVQPVLAAAEVSDAVEGVSAKYVPPVRQADGK